MCAETQRNERRVCRACVDCARGGRSGSGAARTRHSTGVVVVSAVSDRTRVSRF